MLRKIKYIKGRFEIAEIQCGGYPLDAVGKRTNIISQYNIPNFKDSKATGSFLTSFSTFFNPLKIFGINEKVYVDFCQMANNNVGAYWLSKDKAIRNPYFGADMLSSGSVTDQIEK